MRAWRAWIVAAVMTAGLGCSALLGPKKPPPILTSVEVATQSTVARDEFAKTVTIDSPLVLKEDRDIEVLGAFLRAVYPMMDPGSVSYVVYVTDGYARRREDFTGSWKFLETAHDEDGNARDVQVVSRNPTCHPGGCLLREDVVVSFDPQYLRTHRDRGLRFKIAGRAGEAVITIPPSYVAGFLDRLDRELAGSVPSPAATK